MAYTLTNLQDDIKSYTEVDDTVFSTAILNTIIKNAENRIYREVDSDDNRFYATSNLQSGSRYVTIPSDLRSIRYVQIKDSTVTPNVQYFLEKRETSYMSTFYDTPSTTATAHSSGVNVFPSLKIQTITTRTENTGAMPATKTVNTGFTVTLPYNAVGTITGGGENAFVSPMFRGIK